MICDFLSSLEAKIFERIILMSSTLNLTIYREKEPASNLITSIIFIGIQPSLIN